jgi:ankyrin repeat protein
MSTSSSSSRDHDLSTALCLAARHGDSVRLRELISLGANVMTAHETDGTTPLIAAVISGDNESVNVLISEKGKGQVKLADSVRFFCRIYIFLCLIDFELTISLLPPLSPLSAW